MSNFSGTNGAERLPRISFWLTVGVFAVATEGLMIAGLLPVIITELEISIAIAGHLVTAFALAYLIGSPILTSILAGVHQRIVLVGSMCFFIFANVLAFFASTYIQLISARILIALAVGVYMPVAYYIATAVPDAKDRAKRVAVLTMGQTSGMLFGVPLATLIGHQLGWRSPFLIVALFGTLSLLGTLKASVPSKAFTSSSLRDRLLVAKRPIILSRVILSALWSMSGYSIYIYVGSYLQVTANLSALHFNDSYFFTDVVPYFRAVIDASGTELSVFLLIFGAAGVLGSWLGGRCIRWIKPDQVVTIALVCLVVAYTALAIIPRLLSPTMAMWPVFTAIFFWGVAGWAFQPAQVTRLSELAHKDVTVALSVNQSFVYAGIWLAGMVTPLAIEAGSVVDIAWVAVACALAALVHLHVLAPADK